MDTSCAYRAMRKEKALIFAVIAKREFIIGKYTQRRDEHLQVFKVNNFLCI